VGRHVVVGAGAVGLATAGRLAELGEQVVLASRRGTGPAEGPIGLARVDAADPGSLSALCEGAAAVYNCVNPPYHRWATDWPPVAAAFLEAAEVTGARLVTMSNLYGYGVVDHPITEEDPLRPNGTKGAVRAAMWQAALAAHEAGRVRVAEARASDFFGPGVTDQGMLGERVVRPLLAGKAVSVLGDPDAAHSWTYVPDVGELLAALGTTADERLLGRPWHVPTAPASSAREMVRAFAEAAGVPAPAVRRLPWLLVRAAGLVVPALGELSETRHQFDRPFELDSSAATSAFGLAPTARGEAAAATVRWWRLRGAQGSGTGAGTDAFLVAR